MLREGWGVLLYLGRLNQEGTMTWIWNLDRDSPVLGRGSREGYRKG